MCLLLLCSCAGGFGGGEIIIEEGTSELSMSVYGVDTLNPVKTKSASVAELLSLVYEPLFSNDADLKPVACLAKSIQVTQDGLFVRLHLAEDVRWHSGAAFCADDVVYTINEIKNSDSFYKHNVALITDCVAENGTVLLTLTEPVMNIEGLLTFPIIRNGSAAELENMSDGTGAFCISEKSASEITLVPNKYHEKVSVSAISVSVKRNAAACVNAFEANEVDLLTSSAVNLGEQTPAGDIQTYLYASNCMTFLGFNCTLEKYSTPYLRIAVNELVNRAELVEKALFGKASVCKYPFNPQSWLYSDIDGLEIDVEGSMKNAGYTKVNGEYLAGDGAKAQITILVPQENARKISAAEMIASTLKSEGIDASLQVVPFDEYSRMIQEKNYDAFIGEVTMPDNLDPALLTDAGNYFGFFDETLSGAAYNLKLARSSDELAAAVLDYERAFTVNPPCAPLYYRSDGVVYKKSISGITEPNFYNNLRGTENLYFTAVSGKEAANG